MPQVRPHSKSDVRDAHLRRFSALLVMLAFCAVAPFHPYKVAVGSCVTLLLVELAWRRRCSPLTSGGDEIRWYRHRFWMKHYWWLAFACIWFVFLPTLIPDDRSWSAIFKQLDPESPSLAGKLVAWAFGSVFPLMMGVLPLVAQTFSMGTYVVGVTNDELLLVPMPPWKKRIYRRSDVIGVVERVPSISIGGYQTFWLTRVQMRDGLTFTIAPVFADPDGLRAALKASASVTTSLAC